jgi:nitrogen fixation/metabolism regulation signal transduction histidine kinase
MKLRTSFTAYLVAVHVLLFGCATLLLPIYPWLFVGAEALLVASLVLGWWQLRRALAPLGYTQRFHDLLADQQYASRLAVPGMRELDDLVATFNTMLATLHRERLAIGEQQGFLDRLLAATPNAVLVFDFDHALSLVNASAVTLLGMAQPLGRRLANWEGDARTRDLVGQLDALPLGESDVLTDLVGRRYRAQRSQFFDRGFARHFLMVEELTTELEESERATYERLVRVLAHEVNNTVAATGSVLDSLLAYRGQLHDADASDFTTAIVAVKRRNTGLGEFIDRFTKVVKMPAPELRPAHIGAVMDDILWLNREQCHSRAIDLSWGRRDAVGTLQLDVQLMEQALLNIVKNAIEAIDAGNAARGTTGGAIRIELQATANGAQLSVVDSGGGLDATPMRQLFTPFFSTKKGGQGIGLMFVREVLSRHGCSWSLAAGDPGETRFDIWLAPAAS